MRALGDELLLFSKFSKAFQFLSQRGNESKPMLKIKQHFLAELYPIYNYISDLEIPVTMLYFHLQETF